MEQELAASAEAAQAEPNAFEQGPWGKVILPSPQYSGYFG